MSVMMQSMHFMHGNDTGLKIVNETFSCQTLAAPRFSGRPTGVVLHMISNIKKTIAATALGLAVASPAIAMEDEVNMLTGSVFNMLSSMQMDTASMINLTLGEVNTISNIVHSGDNESEKRSKIGAILRRAAER